MSFLTCWRLRRWLTRYADGELPAAERGIVDRHLADCEACLRRVRIEAAVRGSLRDRTARAGSTAWLARPELPALPAGGGWHPRRTALAAGLVILLVFWGSRWLGPVRVEAVGVISDSHCNGVHRPPEAPDVDPPACIQGCLRMGARLVFVSGGMTYTIRNHDVGHLTTDAGRMVRVSGTADGEQLTLSRINPVR
jgi:hypothetical protein